MHLAHPIGGGYGQRIQKRGRSGHILAGPGKGGVLPLCSFDHHSLACLKCRFALVQVGQSSLHGLPLVGELTLSLRGFAVNVIL
jgi:hypothetical protein